MTAGITAIVLAKNEEKNIKRCIESLAWCDEIIIIDDYSTDDTVKLAQKYKVRIIRHHLNNNFSEQRNFACDQSSYPWVLFVDADEEVSLSLQYEITNILNNQFHKFNGFYIKRIDEMWGRRLRHGELGSVYLLRLAKKKMAKWIGKVHEEWKVEGSTEKLQNSLAHYPHRNVTEFLADINYYSSLRAEELVEKKSKVSAWQIILYPVAKFILNYIFRLGFLDGIAGLVVAIMMSLHSFLVRGKAWTWYDNKKT